MDTETPSALLAPGFTVEPEVASIGSLHNSGRRHSFKVAFGALLSMGLDVCMGKTSQISILQKAIVLRKTP